MKKILVIGGTGMLGYPVAKALKKHGYEVTIFTRDIKRAQLITDENFDFQEGDIFNQQSLIDAMKGKHGIHINLQGGPRLKDYEKTEGQGTLKIVLAAKETGIKYITLITAATVDEKNTWFPTIKAKYSAETYLKSSGIDYTIFRPSWFMESLPLFVQGKKASVIGNNPNKYSWIAAEDYAQMVADAYATSTTNHKTIYVYGPEKYTMKEALEKYCKVKHPDIKPGVVSAGTLKFIGTISFNPQLKMIAELMKYFEKVQEPSFEIPTDIRIFHPQTTLNEWIATVKTA